MSTPESALDIVANAELKALTYMSMDGLGEATHVEVWRHLHETLDLDKKYGRESTIGRYALTFATHGFAEVEMKPSKHLSRLVRHYRTVQSDATIPEIGASLGWADTHSLPLEIILSRTASKGSRAPTNSILMLNAALRGTEITEAFGEAYADGNPQNTRLYTLIEKGVVIEDDSRNRFRIKDPTYKGTRIPFDKLKYESQHFYTSLKVAKELYPDREWSFSELFDFSCLLLPQHLRGDEQFREILRDRIVRAVSIYHPHECARAIDKIDLSKRYLKVTDNYAAAVADIVERVERLRNPAFRALYRDTAYDIYRDAETARRLILRGQAASTHRNAGRRQPPPVWDYQQPERLVS